MSIKTRFNLNKNICIIGCGWLGLPLAKSLLKKGASINGSTTSSEKLQILTSEGIQAFKLKLSSEGISGDLESCLGQCDTLILNIPPGLRRQPNKDYVRQMRNLMPYIETSNISKVLFISSTSVYDDDESFRSITELSSTSANSETAKQLLVVEQLFQQNSNFDTTILRFSGLFGNDRHPAKFLSGSTNLKNGNAPVNLIHLEDCIGIIETIITQEQWNTVFNASTEPHPIKAHYYTSICKALNLPIPEFNSEIPSKGKIIDASKLAQHLNYKFKVRL